MTTDLRHQLQRSLGATYNLEQELTGGGMSRVFIAHDGQLDRKVVVKVLSPDLAAGVSTERFKREIRLVASLQQANIVPLLSAGETNGLPFYTMPFVEGRSLRNRLTGAPLSLADAVSILRDIARALTYAHEHGVVHRDI
ncbi:MAG TPA: protein kinase, partial [Gemmatimonadaceae bacterium]